MRQCAVSDLLGGRCPVLTDRVFVVPGVGEWVTCDRHGLHVMTWLMGTYPRNPIHTRRVKSD